MSEHCYACLSLTWLWIPFILIHITGPWRELRSCFCIQALQLSCPLKEPEFSGTVWPFSQRGRIIFVYAISYSLMVVQLVLPLLPFSQQKCHGVPGGSWSLALPAGSQTVLALAPGGGVWWGIFFGKLWVPRSWAVLWKCCSMLRWTREHEVNQEQLLPWCLASWDFSFWFPGASQEKVSCLLGFNSQEEW